MKLKLYEIFENPTAKWLLGNEEIELGEIELAILGMPSSISYQDALVKWNMGKPGLYKKTLKEKC